MLKMGVPALDDQKGRGKGLRSYKISCKTAKSPKNNFFIELARSGDSLTRAEKGVVSLKEALGGNKVTSPGRNEWDGRKEEDKGRMKGKNREGAVQ